LPAQVEAVRAVAFETLKLSAMAFDQLCEPTYQSVLASSEWAAIVMGISLEEPAADQSVLLRRERKSSNRTRDSARYGQRNVRERRVYGQRDSAS
jgi:hypothetical protein